MSFYLIENLKNTKMKNIYKKLLLGLLSLGMLTATNASTSVKLKMNHKLGSVSYVKNTQSTNNLNHNFNITRLEYYVSNVVVIHDGGTMDTIKDTYFLVNPSGSVESYDLGTITLTTIEAIQFSIGVDKAANHLNPASYGALHPLAPKSPSMHWGWTAGYRFIAIEGKSGTSMDQTYELHGLGDANYFTVQIPVTAVDDNGSKIIELNADYKEILKNISLNSGVVDHGVDDNDLVALKNMRDHVFTSTSGQGNSLNVEKVEKYSINTFPNPANKAATISLSTNYNQSLYYKVYNLNGKLIKQTEVGVKDIILELSGIFQIQAYSEKHILLASKKQIII